MTQVTVISGVERRRTWTDDQKLELIEATLEPGANVSEIARAADIAPAKLYRWRKELLDPDSEVLAAFTRICGYISAFGRATGPERDTTRRFRWCLKVLCGAGTIIKGQHPFL
jgi:hypothetical protein